MKKILPIIIFSLLSVFIYAQEGNLGAFVGLSYYNGEVNPQKVLFMPSPAYGIMYRHNVNDRWALRFQADYSIIQGSDAKSKNSYQQIRNYSFSNTYYDLGMQVELNFMQYDKKEFMTEYFTPYISTGVYLSYMPTTETPLFVSVPIEFGMKYALTKKITIGALWSYRWTSSDEVDALAPDPTPLRTKQNSYNPNKDLISFMGVFMTVSLFREHIFCPAY